jgi:hypothetical protein
MNLAQTSSQIIALQTRKQTNKETNNNHRHDSISLLVL